jgi:hypothetical protein
VSSCGLGSRAASIAAAGVWCRVARSGRNSGDKAMHLAYEALGLFKLAKLNADSAQHRVL